MAVVFSPKGIDAITIGGTTATGPFPKYSVATERTATGDGTLLDLTYSITVTGQVLASGNITTAGARQNSLQAAVIAKLTSTETPMPVGTLEITAYGGLSDVLQFNDAVLESIDFGEQDDDSGGVQYQDYTFNFTAHKRNSTKTGNTYTLSSAEESWDIAENSEFTYEDNDITKEFPQKTFTITHNVSATGYNKHTDTAFNESGWKQAKGWVLSRLVTTPGTAITKNVADDPNFTDFKGTLMGDSSGGQFIDLEADYDSYNHGRVATSDLSGGAYSVTETWYVSPLKVTHEVDVSYDEGEDGIITVTVNGSITGLSTKAFSTNEQDKITQADSVLSTVLDKTYSLADSVYKQLKPTFGAGVCTSATYALNATERSKSISKNKVSGLITYTLTYNDAASTSANTISENLSITDDNEDRTNNIVAIIQIIGRANGPIFQDMATTNERKRSVNLEWVMNRCNRDSKPSTDALVAASSYKPSGTAYQLSKSEQWTPSTGAYSLSIEWAY
tara:strand:+ start:885 stop:2399 length:1515 start_codon:yes stop_codon:yes gene_type:complete